MQPAIKPPDGGLLIFAIGDSMMAEFGTPEHPPLHARAAMKLRRHAQGFAQQFKARYPDPALPAFRIGVGAPTGEAIVGSIGTKRRSEFTAIGDVVNVIARVEGLTTELGRGGVVLATRECISAVGDGTVAEDRGTHAVKGRSEPVQVFAVTATNNMLRDKRCLKTITYDKSSQ